MIITFLLLTIWSSAVLGGPLPPFGLKCENNLVGLSKERLQQLDKHVLVGIDNPNPVFSWTVSHSERSASQSAFQLLVYEDKLLSKVFWNSGKILSKEITYLKYRGPPLTTAKTFFWQVLWWDHRGEVAVSEETGHFLVAILDPSEWDDSQWIAAGDEINTAPYIYKMFSINSSNVTNAALYVSGLGLSKPFVNGVDLNARYDPPIALTPGWTNYEKQVSYTAYDITSIISNTDRLLVGVMLGQGWRNTKDYTFKDSPSLIKNDTTERVLRVLITINTNDSTVKLVSDKTWKSSETNISFDAIYNGETYGFKDAHQLVSDVDVQVVPGPSGEMYLPQMPYIAELRIQKPVNSYPLYDDRGFPISQIVDFGENNAGYCQLFNDFETTFELHHAEVAMHLPYGKANGSLYYVNLRGAEAKDVYLGNSNFTYKPSFTYHGFRYVEVKGLKSLKLTDKHIQKIVINSNLKQNSKFESSIPILNTLHDACVRSQQSNFMSVVTDCPQRDERLGWLGDAALSAESMTLNFDMQAFHLNTLNLMKADIVNGTLPDVVPYYRYGSRPADPSWSAAFPEILYRLVTYDKNLEAAKEYYSLAFNYIITTANSIPDSGISKMPHCYYGDWVPAAKDHTQDNSFTGAFSYLMSIKQVIEIADILNQTEDSMVLQKLLETYINQFNEGFMTSNTEYLDGYQESYILPLTLGAVRDDMEKDIIVGFLNAVEAAGDNGIYITGGIVTVRYMFPLLTKIGQHEIALRIAQRTDFPSYGFMFYNSYEPSSTIWELWNAYSQGPSMDSRNHHMFSSISGWLVTDVAGLSLHRGYDEIHFHPARALGVSHASVSLQYPKPIHLSWLRSGGVQCAKQVENRSPLNPNLPQTEDLTVSCGHEDGGVIAAVLFASYGNPEGHCGGYYKLGTCHVSNSLEVIEKLCLGRKTCTVSTRADFWGNPCQNTSKWLIVSVQCKSEASEVEDFLYSSIMVNISVPMGSQGILHLPTHGKQNMKLIEGKTVIYSESSGLNSASTAGVISYQWDPTLSSYLVNLDSGEYSFTWKGDNPNRNYIDSKSTSINNGTHKLECTNTTEIITSINWASFGNPKRNSESRVTYRLGKCHAGSSKFAVEKECIGKPQCTIFADKSFFGDMPCLENLQQSRLIVEYSCGFRYEYQKRNL